MHGNMAVDAWLKALGHAFDVCIRWLMHSSMAVDA